jgi:hypothetical protein
LCVGLDERLWYWKVIQRRINGRSTRGKASVVNFSGYNFRGIQGGRGVGVEGGGVLQRETNFPILFLPLWSPSHRAAQAL